jgi:hypothetical protein
VFELPGHGHGVVFASGCAASLLLAFVADPASTPDGSCVAALGPPEWVLP